MSTSERRTWWKINVLQLNALVHAVDSFPPNTPKRWSLVSQLVCLGTNVTSSLTVEVGAGGGSSCTIFDGSEDHCKGLYLTLLQNSPDIFQHRQQLTEQLFQDGTKSAFKPLVLLPGQMECCGRKVHLRYVCWAGLICNTRMDLSQ